MLDSDILYSIANKIELVGYIDNDWTCNTEERNVFRVMCLTLVQGHFLGPRRNNR